MNLNFAPFIVLETLLVLSVAALFIWRKMVSRDEDDNLHVLHQTSAVAQQEVVSHKLDIIDKWGKILTVVTVVLGLVIGAVYVYNSFLTGTGIGS